MSDAAQNTQTTSDEEREWVRCAAEGDMVAFRQLYDRHAPRVASHVRRLMGPGPEIEDVVQEIFVQVHRSLDSFRFESAFSTWLYQVTRNVAITHLRQRSKTVDLDAWRPLRAPLAAWPNFEARDLVRTLHAILEQSSVENREAFLLYEVEGRKLREIADLTGESINTIAGRVRRTRERVREILEATQGEVAHD